VDLEPLFKITQSLDACQDCAFMSGRIQVRSDARQFTPLLQKSHYSKVGYQQKRPSIIVAALANIVKVNLDGASDRFNQ